jgi:hypothetical protein
MKLSVVETVVDRIGWVGLSPSGGSIQRSSDDEEAEESRSIETRSSDSSPPLAVGVLFLV